MIASFALIRYPQMAILGTLLGWGFDLWRLNHQPGLRFYKLMGSGRGRTFDARADLCRYALFAVWQDEQALDRFEAASPVWRRFQRRSREYWAVRLKLVQAHGRWGGRDPFAPQGGNLNLATEPGPWAILTRARIRPSKLRAFWQAVPDVAARFAQSPGLIASVGVGEWPLAWQATFSLWHILPSAVAFAYHTPEHSSVIRRVRSEDWYAEELFARFRPYASAGTWDGEDPLERYKQAEADVFSIVTAAP